MNIVIVGPGAIGILFGSLLIKSGQQIVFLDHTKERINTIRKRGIIVENKATLRLTNIKIVEHVSEVGPIDLCIICVKSYDTKAAARSIKKLVGEQTTVLTLQNGLGNIEILSELIDPEKIVCAVTNHGSYVIDDGHVKHAGKGETIIGRIDGKMTVQLKRIREVFNAAGITTRLSRDVKSILWTKLVINVGINALSALLRVSNGMLPEQEGSRTIMRQAVSEAVRIAKRKRIKLLYDDMNDKTEAVCEATHNNVSSMLQDVLRKKRTEIDALNGAIIRYGQSLSVPTPTNTFLVNAVRTIEATYAKTLVR